MIKVNDFLFEYDYNDSFAYRLFKALSKGAGLDLKRAVDKFNQTFPEIKTTPQNVSNKLTRDSIKLTEFCRFAESFGYEIVFRRIGDTAHEDDSAVAPVVTEKRTSADNAITEPYSRPRRAKIDADKAGREKMNELVFAQAVNEGCVSVTSNNFGEVIFAGKRAEEVADFYSDSVAKYEADELTEAGEVLLLLHLRNQFNIHFKLLDRE